MVFSFLSLLGLGPDILRQVVVAHDTQNIVALPRSMICQHGHARSCQLSTMVKYNIGLSAPILWSLENSKHHQFELDEMMTMNSLLSNRALGDLNAAGVNVNHFIYVSSVF